MTLSAPQQKRQLVANLSRHRPNSDELVRARQELAAAKLEDYIKRTVDSAPPLTDAQRTRLTALLRPVAEVGGPNAA